MQKNCKDISISLCVDWKSFQFSINRPSRWAGFDRYLSTIENIWKAHKPLILPWCIGTLLPVRGAKKLLVL